MPLMSSQVEEFVKLEHNKIFKWFNNVVEGDSKYTQTV